MRKTKLCNKVGFYLEKLLFPNIEFLQKSRTNVTIYIYFPLISCMQHQEAEIRKKIITKSKRASKHGWHRKR